MPASKAKQAETAERRNKAIQMRLAGMDWETIAQRLNYSSRGAACTDVTRALERYVVEARASAEVLREQELARLDRLQAAAWVPAAQGDMRSIDTVLRIIDRRCKLLGLDAAVKHEIMTIDALDAQIRDLEQQLGTRVTAAGQDG